MEAYKFNSGPMEKGQPSEHWALRSTKAERRNYEEWMRNPDPLSKRKPMRPIVECIDGVWIKRWEEIR